MTLPTVDIIIAARNEERYLGLCLNALKLQDYRGETRVYVIDNGSSDNTVSVAERHGACVLREPKSGAAAARNLGLANGGGELVGFLDAHCIVEKDWVRLMAEQCALPGVGGCQGWIENRSVDRRVQSYLDESGAYSNERVIADTVSGDRNIYPWILSGDCIYRRQALDEAGRFDERLEACEDVDLAWRVVLLGYQLTYVARARLVHYDCSSWHGFLKKGLRYGRAAAVLASIYQPYGAGDKFLPTQIWSSTPERLFSGLYYWSGYKSMEWRLRLNLSKRTLERPRSPVLSNFRPIFRWASGASLRISPDVIFWFRDDRTSTIVHIPTNSRIVLEAVGDLIWRLLVAGVEREPTIQKVIARYGVAYVTASADIDDFIEELIDEGILIKEET